MAYGTVKVDNITFTNGGIDQTVTVSGIVQSISGNITATGTIQAATIIGTSTVSGATVTGTAGVFTTVTGGSAGFTTVTGTTVTGTTANFATLSGTTITGSVGNFGSGSEAAPSVSVGTTDNGIYSPGADQVAISSSGVGRLFVDSSGNVAIGTSSTLANTFRYFASSPTIRLSDSTGTASNLTAQILFQEQGTTSAMGRVGYVGGDAILRIKTDGAEPIVLATNDTERLRITSDGKVGLGTSSPSAKAEISGQSGSINLRLTGNSATAVYQDFYQPGSAQWGLINPASTDRFSIVKDGPTGTEYLTITSTGVGVGSTSPLSIFDAKPSSNRHVLITSSASYADNGIVATNDAGSEIALGIGGTPIQFFTGATERARIDSSGRLGIGTSSPSSYNANADNLVVFDSGSAGITIAAGSASYGSLYFADGTTGAQAYAGYVQYNHADDKLYIGSGADNTITCDSSQRVGIGTTTPSFVSGYTGLQVDGGSNGPVVRLTNSTTGSTSTDGFDIILQQGGSDVYIWQRESAPLIFGTAATERARIDSSGRLLIGTSSSIDSDSIIQIKGRPSGTGSVLPSFIGGNTTDLVAGNALCYLNFFDGFRNGRGAYIGVEADASWGANDFPTRLVFSTTADGASSPTERMRITNGGNVLFKCTGIPDASIEGFVITGTTSGNRSSSGSSTAAYNHFLFYNGNGIVGSISTSGSATTYATSSDYRLKENVVPITNGITRVKQLAPKRFNFIADADTTVDGFLAHEAQTVVPEAVTGNKDEVDENGDPVMQGIDQSKLVPLLTAALQEAVAKIESLEARLTAAGI